MHLSRRPGAFPALLALLVPLTSCNFGLEPLNIGTDSQGNPIFDTEADTDADADADGDSDADGDTDSDTDVDGNVAVTGVEPYYGTTAGGQAVTITGGPFDSSATVRFGANSATVQSVNSSSLSVSTPSATDEGSVDVIVATDAGSGSFEDAFFYFEDGQGEAGAIGVIGWYELLGNFWKDPTPYGVAWTTFIVPQDFHIWDWYAPGSDNCVDDSWSPTGEVYVYDMDVSTITIRPSSGSPATLSWDNGLLEYINEDLSTSQFQANSTYSLDEITSSSFPAFSMSDLARTPSSFSITYPAMTGTQPARVNRNSFELRWSGSGGDKVIIMAFLYNSAGSAIDQEVYCVVEDDGSFTIPSSAWSGFDSNRYIQVIVMRMLESGGTIDYNLSESRVVGAHANIGLVMSQ